MIRVRAAPAHGLRVILCMKFVHHAAFKEVADFKRLLISHDKILHSVEVSGSFDFMVEAEHQDFNAYQEMLDELAGRYGHLIENYEASFVCRRYLRDKDGEDEHVWVPTDSGLRRVDHQQIDRVTAEGDYVRIHSGGKSWLLHSTMRKFSRQLGSEHFLRLNRSCIVRSDFIERLIHDYRRWSVRLFDGTEHPIAKARSAHIISQLKGESSRPGAASSDGSQPTDKSMDSGEKLLQ